MRASIEAQSQLSVPPAPALISRKVSLPSASPFSSASHYALDSATGRWVSTRSDADLLKLLGSELGKAAGADVDLG